ncbi:MAG: FIST C-terminal domain-containing protein [Planctomycetes bacterium]|nr:FIST C-terminal domain-containing protein [Planctomycetota bacterium]MBL7008146.1 FIST C-terminal domain-containing protein [Planctomycetota bacterium]
MRVSGRFSAAVSLSTEADTDAALDEAATLLLAKIGAQPDLVLAFFTGHHSERAERISARVRELLAPDSLVGCSAAGVIGAGREVERGPGLVLWAARMPGARVQAFHLQFETSEGGGMVHGWPDAGDSASAVLMVDPFSFPLDPFLSSLRDIAPMPRIVGGVASSGQRPGSNRLLVNDKVVAGGAVGFVLDGAAKLEPLVSQGCRPVGRAYTVTRSERNVIYELDEAPAYDGLSEVVEGLDDGESRAFRSAPQVGLEAVKSTGDLGQEGYLIRGVVGIDQESGAVAISDAAPEGMRVRFHARDGATAHEDLGNLLGLASGLYPEAGGGLLFSCTGRGEHLFGEADHDAVLAGTYFPDLPIAGMFAAGEIGSVCGLPYIHGFTASLGLLVECQA